MGGNVVLTDICVPSESIVARVIEGELIIVPLVSGIGDAEDELYTLNPIGHSIWEKFDGKRTIGDIVTLLVDEFDAPRADIEKDVIGLVNELSRRKMLSIINNS
jgi:hypothetical protein